MSGRAGYLMDDPRESARLAAKVDAAAWVARYVAPHLSCSPDVLDVGCGPGVIARAAAEAFPSGHFSGIDLSAERFTGTAMIPPNLRLLVGDARCLDLGADTFDFVYSRFLLEYLADRQRAVAEIIRVCKPGGQVLLQDLDGQLLWHYPVDEELQSQLASVVAALEVTGFDPYVGRKLHSMARASGLIDIRVTAESYHLYAGRIDESSLSHWRTKLAIASPAIARVLGSHGKADVLVRTLIDYLQRDDTLTYSVVFTVVGRKPLAE